MSILEREPLKKYDFSAIKNVWEEMVFIAVSDLITNGEMCPCHDCVLDTCAVALNSLPPKYWFVDSYDLFFRRKKFEENISNIRMAEEAVYKAYQIVQKNPHH
ncbi:MAG: late competence development ComFB family protein [Candidatus Riflebacteria bacterium]|nr:late competence development ComFB family protein [Candidatus Riflebacteria bacterium]